MNILDTMKQALEWMPPAHPATENLRAAIKEVEEAEPVTFIDDPRGGEMIPCFTYPPDAQAEIKRLTNERTENIIYADKGAKAWAAYANELSIKIERQQAEIERLMKDNDALVKIGMEQDEEMTKLRYQLSAAVTHGADLMRDNESLKARGDYAWNLLAGHSATLSTTAGTATLTLSDGRTFTTTSTDEVKVVWPEREGWQLVPKEPTPEMLEYAYLYSTVIDRQAKKVWHGMLAAAPKLGEKE